MQPSNGSICSTGACDFEKDLCVLAYSPLSHSVMAREGDSFYFLDVCRCTILDGANGPDVTWGGKISPTSTSGSSIYFDMSAFDWVIYEATRTMRWEAAVADVSFSPV